MSDAADAAPSVLPTSPPRLVWLLGMLCHQEPCADDAPGAIGHCGPKNVLRKGRVHARAQFEGLELLRARWRETLRNRRKT